MKVLRYDDCLLICDHCFCEGLCERESDRGLRSGFGSVRGQFIGLRRVFLFTERVYATGCLL